MVPLGILRSMNADLRAIASLEFGKAVEAISQETQQKLIAARTGKPRGGAVDAAALQVQLDAAEEVCRAMCRIWIDLLEKKNRGPLTRQDANYISQQVGEVAASRKASLLGAAGRSGLASAGGLIERRLAQITASMKRDLEIVIRKQQAFAERDPTSKQPHSEFSSRNAAQPAAEQSQASAFQFMNDGELRSIVERDFAELAKLGSAGATKSRIILSGELIESLLLDAVESEMKKGAASKAAPKTDLDQWNLAQLIDVALELKLISDGAKKLGHGVRDYRNLVHPAVERRSRLVVEEQEARIAEEVLGIVIRDLRRFYKLE